MEKITLTNYDDMQADKVNEISGYLSKIEDEI